MKFRENRRSIEDSLRTVVELDTRAELVEHVNRIIKANYLSAPVPDADVKIEYYFYDWRIKWRTYQVTVRDFGLLGYTDSDFSEKPEGAIK